MGYFRILSLERENFSADFILLSFICLKPKANRLLWLFSLALQYFMNYDLK